MRLAAVSTVLLLLFVAVPTARAEDPPDPVQADVQAWFDAKTSDARAAVAMRLAFRGVTPKAVHAVLPKIQRYAHPDTDQGAAGKVVEWTRTTGKDRTHTIYARVPESYDAAKPTPVLIWLHGGVRRDSDGGGAFGANALGERADAHGFIVLSPSAYAGVAWWTPEGVGLVRGALDDAKARWHVDANRVYVSGFSDGGSGCYHLLAHDPDPYAAFLPMMGHPAFTRMLGGPTYASNVQSRPVFAVNGGKDQLYPSATLKPLIDGLEQAGCDITWKDLPEAGHSLNHVTEVWNELWAFAQAHPRDAASAELRFACWDPKRNGRLDWIEVLRVDPKATGDTKLEAKELALPRRVVLGVRLDMAFQGPGLRIASVEPDSAAEAAGVLEGDVLVKVGDTALGAPAEAVAALRKALTLTDGGGERTLSVTVEREGKTVALEIAARVPDGAAGTRPAALGYDVPVGVVVAKRTSRTRIDLRTRHVGALRLHLSRALVDLEQPIEIYVNGKRRFRGVVKPDVAYALGEIRRSGSATPHYEAPLVLRP
ncbi:MAG: PDZ domain-containing protein [Planctomycetota bacterium]|nr:PDZ domain-containing protein [Planctomycetota bacterium]